MEARTKNGLSARALAIAIQTNATAKYCLHGLYIAPASGSTVNPSKSINFEWDPTCFTNTTTKDIEVRLGDSSNDVLYEWSGINATAGQINLAFDASTRNLTDAQPLHFSIAPASSMATQLTSNFPIGPTFTALITPTSGVNVLQAQKHSLSSLQTIGVVVGPILFFGMIGGGWWLYKRTKHLSAPKSQAGVTDRRHLHVSTHADSWAIHLHPQDGEDGQSPMWNETKQDRDSDFNRR
ncbi:hypothetical protein FRB96_000647 [Tulasnella sp. 330]|nr:hypothetical protein FRB96_000647 [Tulasnella sp. 330]